VTPAANRRRRDNGYGRNSFPRSRPIRRKPKKDPVTSDTALRVLARDGYRCVAPLLALRAQVELVGDCANEWGDEPKAADLEIDHVKDTAGGIRQSVERWLQTGCPRHHRLNNFLERADIREAARARLAELYGDAHEVAY
jgi:hypothetical protein